MLFLCLLVPACAAGNNTPRGAPVTAPRSDAGVILSMRSVSGYSAQQPQLAAFRADSGGTRSGRAASLVEFIVRADDGATLSIVQPSDREFRAGDRVVILHEDETRIAPSS